MAYFPLGTSLSIFTFLGILLMAFASAAHVACANSTTLAMRHKLLIKMHLDHATALAFNVQDRDLIPSGSHFPLPAVASWVDHQT